MHMTHMTSLRRAATAAVISGGLATALLGVGAASAVARTTHKQPAKTTHTAPKKTTHATAADTFAAQSAVGSFTAGVFSVQFNAQRAAGASMTAATGTFAAQVGVGTANVITLSGPITCLDVVGNHVGLFYPVTSISPSVIGQVVKGIYVSAQLGREGQPLSMVFRPSLITGVSNCAPEPDAIPVTSGTLTLDS